MSSPRPSWADAVDARLGALPVHPHALSLVKLVAVTPALAWALFSAPADADDGAGARAAIVGALFVAFVVLDALDGAVARARKIESKLGRVLDRVTDYPLVAVVAWAALTRTELPRELVLAKLALDGLVAVLSLVKGRAVDDRVRTVVGDVALLAVLTLIVAPVTREGGVLLQHPFVDVDVVSALLWINIVFSAVVGLYNAGVLQKRFIADSLSAANALCGVASIWFGAHEKPVACLLLLLVGAGFDGLDGAAARRWGGTRFGVLSDDIADGINYAVAPGVALAFTLAGPGGTAVGVVFTLLTISRLVYFTLNKAGGGDPAFFAGVPSTIGGMVALCALILFPDDRAVVGLLVGVAVVLMVSFDSAYRHLGRALFGARRERVIIAVVAGLVLVAGGVVAGPRIPVAVVLGLALVYGFVPQVARFRAALARPRAPAPSSSQEAG